MKEIVYKPRLVDSKIDNYLTSFGAICIEGPKLCGKTMSGLKHSKSQIFIGDSKNNFYNRQLSSIDPAKALEGNTPRLIDEWQEVPSLWDATRFEVDKRGVKGQFILTGSSTPPIKGILHSGIGRIATIRMRTMSLFESGLSSGVVSLKRLYDGTFEPVQIEELSLDALIDYIVRGGWPGNIDTPHENIGLISESYIDSILSNEIFRLDNKRRDTHKLGLLLKALARNESTTVSNSTLQRDIRELGNGQSDIDVETVSLYLSLFERLYLIDNQKPFMPSHRSSVRVKQLEKRHFTDPSLAVALLKLTPDMLANDLQTLGFLFEALCERDLAIYADALDAKLYHYQDYKDNEIDAVVEFKDGGWIAIEIKLGFNQIDDAANRLIKLKARMDKDGNGPKILCVVCGLCNIAYRRGDGVYVVPITALRS